MNGFYGFDEAAERRREAFLAYDRGELGVYEAASDAGMPLEDFEEFAAGERGEL